jgi:hypothetical protein
MTVRARAGRVALLLATASACGGPKLAWYGHTPDRTRLVEVRQQGGTQWLAMDGRKSRRYRAIAADDLAFDPGGRRLAFAAEVTEHPERWVVVADFVEGRSWEGVAGLRFGPGGRRFVYAALDGGRWRMVVDGVPGRPFEGVDVGSLAFSPDGTRVSFVAGDGDCARPVIDAVPGECAVRIVGLAPGDTAGDDVVVLADATDGSSAHVLVGARRVLDLPRVGAMAVDATAKHWAVTAQSHGGWRLVVDGREGEEAFDAIDRVVWAPRGGMVAYAARRNDAWHVVAGGKVSASYAEVEEPVFAANASHVGYVARDAGRSVVAIDNRVVWESAAPATALALSDDGSREGWFYRDGGAAVIAVDGERYPFDVAIDRTLRFSHDGKHWAALAGSLAEHRLFLVVDGRTRVTFDSTELFGSPSGDPGARLGAWVSAELELYLSHHGARGS